MCLQHPVSGLYKYEIIWLLARFTITLSAMFNVDKSGQNQFVGGKSYPKLKTYVFFYRVQSYLPSNTDTTIR